jgi:hypothetical protein
LPSSTAAATLSRERGDARPTAARVAALARLLHTPRRAPPGASAAACEPLAKLPARLPGSATAPLRAPVARHLRATTCHARTDVHNAESAFRNARSC